MKVTHTITWNPGLILLSIALMVMSYFGYAAFTFTEQVAVDTAVAIGDAAYYADEYTYDTFWWSLGY